MVDKVKRKLKKQKIRKQTIIIIIRNNNNNIISNKQTQHIRHEIKVNKIHIVNQ